MDSIICPKCGSIVSNNSYFKGFYCGQCGHYEAGNSNSTLTYLKFELQRTKEMLQVANKRNDEKDKQIAELEIKCGRLQSLINILPERRD